MRISDWSSDVCSSDLLETGDQPLHEPGGAVLVANAEIYNYLELRQALPDVAFATHSDCEPPLHLYRRRGLAFAETLRGMYAIAIPDPAERRLVLARHQIGRASCRDRVCQYV